MGDIDSKLSKIIVLFFLVKHQSRTTAATVGAAYPCAVGGLGWKDGELNQLLVTSYWMTSL